MLVTCSPSCNQAIDAPHHPSHASRSAGCDRGTVRRVSAMAAAGKKNRPLKRVGCYPSLLLQTLEYMI